MLRGETDRRGLIEGGDPQDAQIWRFELPERRLEVAATIAYIRAKS